MNSELCVEITQNAVQVKPLVDTFVCWPTSVPLPASDSDLISLLFLSICTRLSYDGSP